MINIPLGFENLPGLSAKDFVTLAIIRHYIDFKVSIVEENITTVFAQLYLRIQQTKKLPPMSQVTYRFTEYKLVFSIRINSPTSLIPVRPRLFLCTATNVCDYIENKD